MQVAKWGNSLAIRIPVAVARQLALIEGDDVDLTPLGSGSIGISRNDARREAMEAIERLARPFPEGYKFDREEANER